MTLGADLVAVVMLAVKLVASAIQGVASVVPAPPPAVVQPETVAPASLPDVPPAHDIDEGP
jgi:hypothetical protein